MPQPRLSPRLARRCTLVRAAPGWDCINARQRKYARESRLAVSPSCLTSPPMRRGPRKRGTFRARHRCALERRTRRWREPDSNHRSRRERDGPAADHRRLARRPVLNDPIQLTDPASLVGNSRETFHKSGTDGSNPVPSSGESVSQRELACRGREARLFARVCGPWQAAHSAETGIGRRYGTTGD